MILITEDKQTYSLYTFGNSKPKEIVAPLVSIRLKSKYGNDVKIKATVVPQITGSLQRVAIPENDCKAFLHNYKLADSLPSTTQSTQLGILIGNDYYNDILLNDRREIKSGLYVIKSKFGWMLSGRINKNDGSHYYMENSMFVMTHSQTKLLPELQQICSPDDSLKTPPNIEDFWKLETIGVTPPKDEKDDDAIMEQFKQTVTKVNGRYQVKWPWRDKDSIIPENYQLCIGRLKSLQKRLNSDPELFQKYDEIIKNQEDNGMIEAVNEQTEQGEKRHYIPHHAVFKPESHTTKIRIVYDASAKSKKTNPSLNECLYRGPVILEDLCGLLIRFRTKRIGIIADIEKAFLQVEVQPKERDVTRFLWLKNINLPVIKSNIITYRFTRIPFGITSSPFLLGATIKHHLESDVALKNVSESIYVDNLVTGVNSVEEATQLYQSCTDKFKEISINIREWKSNSNQVNKHYIV